MKVMLLISLGMPLIVHLLFLFFISGVVAQNWWGVTYNPTSICAVKGSTVTMGCAYTYPSGYSVKKAFWTKNWIPGAEPPDLSDDPEYRGRVQYLGDKFSDCTLRFRDVGEKDQSKYYFRFITRRSRGHYQGEGGVDLGVTDLQVEVPERVMEGDNATLTCKTTCSLTVTPTFTWYRDGHCLSSSTDQLHLQPVSREDAGRYHCAVLDQNLHSPEVTLNVRYSPKNVSVSISPSGEIVEGSSVTLTCSSDANPPVQSYTWFKKLDKEALLKSTSQNYSISNISSADSGEYQCMANNTQGSRSSEYRTLTVLYVPKKVLVSISKTAENSSVTLTCSSDANPPVQNYTWFKEGGDSPVGSGHSYSVLQSGSYYCVAQNEYGSQKSAAVTVTVKDFRSVVLIAVPGLIAVCGCLILIKAVLRVRGKRQRELANEARHVAVSRAIRVSPPGPDESSQDDYDSVVLHRVKNSRNAEDSAVKASSFETHEELQYVSVQHNCDTGGQNTERDNIQYSGVRFTHQSYQ